MKNRRFLFPLGFAILMLTAYSSMSFSGEYKYEDVANNYTVVIDTEARKLSSQHREEDIYFCERSSKFICMMGALPFAVPREFTTERTEWKHSDHLFRVIDRFSLQMLGKKLDVHRIEHKDNHITTWYLYSKEYGLVAFGTSVGASISTSYITANSCGFGAADECN